MGDNDITFEATANVSIGVSGVNETLLIALSKSVDEWKKQLLAGLTRELRQFTSKMVESIGEQLSEEICIYVSQVGDVFDAALNTLEADAEMIGHLLFQANLWIPPSATMHLLTALKELAQQEDTTSEDVKQIFFGYYEEENWYGLRNMVSSWDDNPYFANRMYIIQDALQAHINGKYTLTIPALLCQVEGILSAILERPAGSTTSMIKDAIVAQHSEFLHAASKDLLIKFATSPMGFGGVKTECFTVEAFPEWLESKGYTESQSLNRHAILHGVQINYASRENSLRVFLLLDVLYWMRRWEWNKKLKSLERISRKRSSL